MHNKGSYKQGEKTAFIMGENNSKWSNRQRINVKNIQATPAAQFQKNKWPNQKMGQRTKQTFLQKKPYRWLTNTWKDAQCHLLSEKCKSPSIINDTLVGWRLAGWRFYTFYPLNILYHSLWPVNFLQRSQLVVLWKFSCIWFFVFLFLF